MDVMFANPTGFWMLLGIPAILAIHFLQNRSPRIPVSTLFLLDHLREEDYRGSVFDRLRQSAALWLQLLAVLLLTLLLVRPLLLRSDSAQAVVIVLDNSYSMRAFKPAVRRSLEAETQRLDRLAATTEWFLQTSDAERPTLYSGTRREELLAAVSDWTPDSAEHDVALALRRAKELAGVHGLSVLVTDHIIESLPPGVALLAVGEPLDNVGFGSLTVEASAAHGAAQWRATLINHSDQPQQRVLSIVGEGVSAAPETLALEPGQVRVLRGEVPPDTGQMVLSLNAADVFALDDTLHMLKPHRRILPAHVALAHEALDAWAHRVMKAVPDVQVLADPANARLLWVQAGSAIDAAAQPGVPRIVLGAGAAAAAAISGERIAEDHPLIRDLSWQGLLCRVVPGSELAAGDQPLLWMAGHPLIYLRLRGDDTSDLHINFDVTTSNAQRHPAIILLLHRFMARVRLNLPGTEAGIVELNQRLHPPPHPGGGPRERRVNAPGHVASSVVFPEDAPIYAPSVPGFFDIRQQGQTIFWGSAVFSETREADFRNASSRNDLEQQIPSLARRYRRDDMLFSIGLILLGVTLLASWFAAQHTKSGVA